MDLPRRFGPYVLLQKLGAGAFGDVHLARPASTSSGLPSPVVVKRLHPELHADPRAVQRFSHEVEIATRIDDPHVVKVYDAGRVDDTLYIAMEHIAGWPLDRVLATSRAVGPPPVAAAVRMIDGALCGLEALHAAEIVHRDIAPKNLMIGEDGRTRLIDLGIGRSSFRDWKTATGMVIGSPGYMSPEQATGDAIDHRTDIYAIGVVFFEALTLTPYLPRGSVAEMLHRAIAQPPRIPSALRADLPAAIDAFVLGCVAPSPGDRFPSVSEARRALERASPRAESGARSVKALLAPMLLDEIGRSKTQVAELLSLVAPPEVSQSHVVFAQRRLASPDVATVSESPSAGPVMSRRAQLPSGLVLTAAIAAAGVVGIAYGRWTAQPPAPPMIVEEPAAEEIRPIVRQRPADAPRRRPRRSSDPSPPKPKVEPPSMEAPVVVTPRLDPPPPPPTTAERLSEMQREAKQIAQSLPATHPRRQDWTDLLTAITMAKLDPKDDVADGLEARLDALRGAE